MTGQDQRPWRQRLGSPKIPYVDSAIYTDKGLFEEELTKIWRKTWLLAVHESELPEALDYRTTVIAREPILIVRGEDLKVRAFLNVCPHRGALLLREPAGNLGTSSPSGGPKHITCMFHAWQFNAQGQCTSIPRRKAGYQDRLECAEAQLREIACEVGYGGFVWLNLDPSPVPLEEHIGKAFDAIGPHLTAEPLEVFHHHKAVVQTNYKLWHETNSEFYHDYMHHFNKVTSMQQAGYYDRRYDAFDNGHVTVSSMTVQYTAYEAKQVALAESRQSASFPGLAENGWKLLDLFPGIAINLRGSALRIDTMTPIDVDKVLIEFRGVGLRSDTSEQRAKRVRDHNTIWGPFGRNLPEDLLGVVSQGLGMRRGSESLHVLQGRIEDSSIHDEAGLRHYYAEWSRRMQRDARAPFEIQGRETPRPRALSILQTSGAET